MNRIFFIIKQERLWGWLFSKIPLKHLICTHNAAVTALGVWLVHNTSPFSHLSPSVQRTARRTGMSGCFLDPLSPKFSTAFSLWSQLHPPYPSATSVPLSRTNCITNYLHILIMISFPEALYLYVAVASFLFQYLID